MLKNFEFTDTLGSKKARYRTLDNVEEIKRFADHLETTFKEHIHKDHSGHPTKSDKQCSYVNYRTYGEVTFPQTRLIRDETPMEYHIIGDRVHILLRNIVDNKRIGIEGYVKLVHAKEIKDFDDYEQLIKELCERKY